MSARFMLQEALRSFGRHRRLSLISLGAMSMALMALGLVGLLNAGLYSLTGLVEEKIDIVAFLDGQVTESQSSALLDKIRDYPRVTRADYISKEGAAAEFAADPDMSRFLEVLGSNPFPASIKIQIQDKTPETVGRFAEWLQTLPGITEASYGASDAARLLRVLQVVRLSVIILTVSLAAAAVVIIGNIISLMVFARQEEIAIQLMIGATPGFIRGPFILWGMLQGAAGGVLASVLLYALWLVLDHYAMYELAIDVGALLPPNALGLALAGAAGLIAAGWLLGFFGSLVSVSRQMVE